MPQYLKPSIKQQKLRRQRMSDKDETFFVSTGVLQIVLWLALAAAIYALFTA